MKKWYNYEIIIYYIQIVLKKLGSGFRVFWIRIRIEIFGWIRIRFQVTLSTDLKH